MHTHTGHQSLSALGSHTLLAVATLTIMVGCVIVPGLPAVAAQLGVGSGGSWLVTLPALGVVLFGPAAARLMERAGLRRALMLGLFLYGLLGAAGPYLRGAWLIYADRLLLGGATALVMAAGTGLISTFYTGRARLAMIARQGMAIELGGVLFLFAGGLLAQQRWSLPFALYLCAWALLALVHFCVPVTAVAAPTFAASTAAPASATPTVSTASRHGGPTAAAAAMPAQVKTAFAAALLSMVAFFAGIIMLPARLAGLGVDEAGTGYFLSFISLVAVGGAALLPALGRRASGRAVLVAALLAYAAAHGCFTVAQSPAQWPALLAGALLHGLGFGLSIPLLNHLVIEHSADGARARHLAYLSMAIFCGQFLSSFMEFLPGGPGVVFAGAGLISLLSAAAFALAMGRQRPSPRHD